MIIKTNPYPKFDQETFLFVHPFAILQPGKVYEFLQYPDNRYITKALCVDVSIIPLIDITDTIAYLDMNCSAKVYRQIMDKKSLNLTSMLNVGVFTIASNCPDYVQSSNYSNVID